MSSKASGSNITSSSSVFSATTMRPGVSRTPSRQPPTYATSQRMARSQRLGRANSHEGVATYRPADHEDGTYTHLASNRLQIHTTIHDLRFTFYTSVRFRLRLLLLLLLLFTRSLLLFNIHARRRAINFLRRKLGTLSVRFRVHSADCVTSCSVVFLVDLTLFFFHRACTRKWLLYFFCISNLCVHHIFRIWQYF